MIKKVIKINNLLFITVIAVLSFILLAVYTLKIRRRLRAQLQVAKSELQHAYGISNARNLFLAGLSHELRTPISGIIGTTQLIKNTSLNNQQHEYLRMINSASTVLLEIIDDMLTFSRINTGNIQLAEINFNLRKSIDDLLLMQSVRLQNRSVALVIDIHDSVPDTLIGDRGKLNQVLLNIIGNAIKYTQEGSITIKIEPKVNKSTNNDYIWLSIDVIDTGSGMNQEVIDGAFQPFQQAKKQFNNMDNNAGMGLGLAICKRLVDAMGGKIELHSQLGEGTIVNINLCFKIAPEQLMNEEKTSISNYLAGNVSFNIYSDNKDNFVANNTKCMTVLVVEDDEINRLVCTRFIATQGHLPIVLANHYQAKKLLESATYMPDVILMDINLVGMSGIQLVNYLRSHADSIWVNVPVIFMSADVSGQAENSCKNINNSCFIPKPFTAQQLQAVINKMVKIYSHNTDSENRSSELFKNQTVDSNHGSELINLSFIQQEILDLGADTVLEMLNIFRSGSVSMVQDISNAIRSGNYSAARNYAHKLKGSSANLGFTRIEYVSQNLYDYLQNPEFVSREHAMDMVLELGMICHPSADKVRAMILHPSEHILDRVQS